MELDAVDGGYLVADLLEERALYALVQTNHKDVPLRGFPLPELVELGSEMNFYKSQRLRYLQTAYKQACVHVHYYNISKLINMA